MSLYLWQYALNKNGHSIVPMTSRHSLVEFKRRVHLTRVSYLILHVINYFYNIIPPWSNLYIVCNIWLPPWREAPEYPIVGPVGSYHGPMCGHQTLIPLLGLEGLLRWGYPHEVAMTVVWVIIHKNSGFSECGMDEWHIDLGQIRSGYADII